MKTRFLHCADIHLGYLQYGLKERFNDFAAAFNAVIDKAIGEYSPRRDGRRIPFDEDLQGPVDFVILAGDLFHKRSIDALTLNQAMRALRDLRRNDQNPIYILTLIARQYRMLIEVKSLLAAGVSNPYDMARRLGYAPYPVQKALQWSHQYTFAELETILERLLEVDMAMKTGADQDTELDLLTAELCMQGRQRAE